MTRESKQVGRRTFVAMLGAALGAIVLAPAVAKAEVDRPKSTVPTRWIGHI